MSPLLSSIAAPVVTALFGLLVVWLQEWRRSRDAFAQRANARAEATELVVFYEKWVRAQKLVATPEEYEAARQVAQDRLDRLADMLPEPEELRAIGSALSLRRLLLLERSPASRAAKIVRGAFYALFVLMLLVLAGSFIPEDDGTFIHWTEIVFTNALMITLTVIARTVAVAFDDRDQRRRLGRLKETAPSPAHTASGAAPSPPATEPAPS